MPKTPIYVVGDPHGLDRILDEIIPGLLARPPGVAIFAGDLELDFPFKVVFAPLMKAGFRLYWILGNHDSDTCQQAENLLHPEKGYQEGNLHLKVVDVEGFRITGLGGIFKARVWLPPDAPKYKSRTAWMQANRGKWKGGLPVHMVDTIWPEDVESAKWLRADLLVTHEGPSSVWHDKGYSVLDELAAAQGCRLIAHGHHHHSGSAILPGGTLVKSLAKGEIFEVPR